MIKFFTKTHPCSGIYIRVLEYLYSETSLEIFFLLSFTLSLLGYLKTRIRWGGGSIWPPPLNPMFDVQIWQIIHHWKALVLYFWNLQKNVQISFDGLYANNFRRILWFKKQMGDLVTLCCLFEKKIVRAQLRTLLKIYRSWLCRPGT